MYGFLTFFFYNENQIQFFFFFKIQFNENNALSIAINRSMYRGDMIGNFCFFLKTKFLTNKLFHLYTSGEQVE